MVGWHHRLNGHEFEQAPGDGEGQRSLMRCSPWGRKEVDTTERLNNNNKITWVRPAFTTLFKISVPRCSSFSLPHSLFHSIYDIKLHCKKQGNNFIVPHTLDSECPGQTCPSSLEEWLVPSSFSLYINIC